MFNSEIKKRLKFLKHDKNVIELSQTQLELIEKSDSGKAKLMVNVKNPCIAFKQLDDNKFGYLEYAKCADNIIFEKNSDTWTLHIIEFKKTVKKKEWEKIKKQFAGAFLNAEAIAGYLGIKIDYDNIKLYTGFRNDKVNDNLKANPVELKMQVGKSAKDISIDWDENLVMLEIFDIKKCIHNKIILDSDTGEGDYSI